MGTPPKERTRKYRATEKGKAKTLEYRNAESTKEYQKQYRQTYKEKLKAYGIEWRKQRAVYLKAWHQGKKQALINMKGGKCELCGWTGHASVFDFHHKDPTTKDISMSGGSMWKLVKFRDEKKLDELQLLCANCHRLIHHKDKS